MTDTHTHDQVVWVCAECDQPLTRRFVPEDDEGSDRAEYDCPTHGTVACIWGATA